MSLLRPILIVAAALVSTIHAAEIEVAGLKFKAAEGWALAKGVRPMSAGSLVREGESGVEAIFYHFPGGQGGDIEANLERWKSQFAADPAPAVERENINAGDEEIVIASISGSYKGSTMRPEPVPLENHVTLAAIVPGPEGNVFIRLNASKEDAEKVRAEFRALAKSPHPGD